MATTLKLAMQRMLDGWQEDLPEAWQEALAGVQPDFDAMDPDLELEPWEPIFPARRGQGSPGAPSGAHIFRGLEGTRPDRIKAVVIGQDPYPNIARATGRAFEPGDQQGWPEDLRRVASSMRRIAQAAAHAISGDDSYIRGDDEWPRVARDIASGTLDIPGSASRLFDRWQRRGVLWLNVGLTLTRYRRGGHPHQLRGHIPLWKPVVGAILTHLAARTSGHVIFLLWGRSAQRAFAELGVEQAARSAGVWTHRVRAVRHGHPSARAPASGVIPLFRPPNPFLESNSLLRDMGGHAITW